MSKLPQIFSTFSRRMVVAGLLGVVLALSLWWAGSWAIAPMVSHPAHVQIQQILIPLVASEAEHVMGAYYPGIGAMVSMDVLRGPNAVPGQPAHVGTRGWAVYLMQTFGGQLTAVPPTEKIAFSIDFYDYDTAVYHQLVLIAQADQIQDATRYEYWLDGQPYDQRAAELGGLAPGPEAVLAPAPVPATSLAPTAAAPPQAGFSQTGGTIDFEDPAQVEGLWQPLAGTWQAADGGYVQTELGRYDLISLLRQPLPETYDIQVSAQWLAGQMGAGLIFDAPDLDTRNNAAMISYTGEGSYLQWGRYDTGGVFQFQGGVTVANGGDGQPHLIGVGVTPTGYTVRLDGVVLGEVTDFSPLAQSYAGLLASTSSVRFDDLTITLGETSPPGGAAPSAPMGFDSTRWAPLVGQWRFTETGYEQTQLDAYDLIAFYQTPVADTAPISYTVGADLQWIEGEMGGGLVFAGADPLSRANTQMISFADNGDYLQWGYYDGDGAFQFQGGATVAGAADGQVHSLAVQVNGDSFGVRYDGRSVGEQIPLAVPGGGYAGLLTSTSHVRFTGFQLTTDPAPGAPTP
ncbi:MAG: hypothetical protein KAZ26_11510 [Caldilineaceae bacterium]|nr:hypothetical protein [Caldilineaceae bacterium]MBP8123261.1 hypothetical protein [Caldilineaceae bacterium]